MPETKVMTTAEMLAQAINYECLRCNAPPGVPCVWKRPSKEQFHMARTDAALYAYYYGKEEG
jgi:hypothetical protein